MKVKKNIGSQLVHDPDDNLFEVMEYTPESYQVVVR